MAMISLSAARRLSPKQNADQHGHGDRDLEGVGQGEEKDLCNISKGRTVANHRLQDLIQIANEENERKYRAPDECVGEDLAEDVAGEDAHSRALPLV